MIRVLLFNRVDRSRVIDNIKKDIIKSVIFMDRTCPKSTFPNKDRINTIGKNRKKENITFI